MEIIPDRSHARRRDRHGRGLRGPILPLSVPSWKTRSNRFDELIALELATYRRFYEEDMKKLDFAVIDVPETDPSPWEDGIPLARYLPFHKGGDIVARLVFYRMPILMSAVRSPDPRYFIHAVVTEQLASALGKNPEDIDFI